MIVLEDKAHRVQPKVRQIVVAHLPNIRTLDHDRAFVRPENAREHAEHRGLAAPGGADNEQHFPEMGHQPDVVHRGHPGFPIAKPFGKAGRDDRLVAGWLYDFRVQEVSGTWGSSRVQKTAVRERSVWRV